MSIDGYRVALARREHIGMLAQIERAAAALFPDDVSTPEIRLSVVPREQLEAALAEERLWTAVTNTETVVGFAIAIRQSNAAFLQEIDVHPAHHCSADVWTLQAEIRCRCWAHQHFPCLWCVRISQIDAD